MNNLLSIRITVNFYKTSVAPCTTHKNLLLFFGLEIVVKTTSIAFK